MHKRLSLRFGALAGMLVMLGVLSYLPASAQATDCSACRRACIQEQRDCVASGQAGCDLVAAECLQGCCPY